MNTEFWNLYNEINESYKNIDVDDINNIEKGSFKNNDLKDKNNDKVKEKCINCNETDYLITESEMIVCTYCGIENKRIIDQNAEWRYYGSDDNKRMSDPNRCGTSYNSIIPDTSLSTVILGKGFEVYRKLNSWNGLSYKQRSLIAILNKIALKANMDNVPQSIIDATMNMYKIISQDYIKRGASRESLIAACFFNALRDQGMIRSTDEVAKLFDIKSKKLSKGCNEFTELMFSKNKEYVKNMKPIESKDLISRFCSLLNINEEFINIGIKCAILVDKLGICQENNPKSIAVGIIYLLSQNYNMGFSKKDIAEQCKTSEVTVSNTYTQMVKFKKYLLPR
jgi:transcription initiation factor TFIIIB Brf1 subunit/transcription initiation factor TFIIB